jgi:uncharacterized membrane protein YvbJ
MYCIQCGAEILKEYNFCTGCGKTLPNKNILPSEVEKIKEEKWKKRFSLKNKIILFGALYFLMFVVPYLIPNEKLLAVKQTGAEIFFMIQGVFLFFLILFLIQALILGIKKVIKKIFNK